MEKVMQKAYHLFVGIDVSKQTFDVGLIDPKGFKLGHKCFKSNNFGFVSMVEWLDSFYSEGELIFCMEHTGVYSRKLLCYLQDAGFDVIIESGFVIRRAAGITKGKSDKLDSYRIAEYVLTHRFKLKVSDHYDKQITLLHDLLSTRNRLIVNLRRLTTPIQELKSFADETNYQLVLTGCQPAIDGIKESIKLVDQEIDTLIESEPSWQENIALATSVKGIGKLICLWMIVYTRNFKATMNARKFASLVGIAPFEESSGISIRKGAHTSHHAHRFLKALLHVSAMTAIRNSEIIKDYHSRKKKEGKKGFVVMNNIKNKLVQTVFAVVRSGQPFDSNFIHQKAA